jgi:hypothetical protein
VCGDGRQLPVAAVPLAAQRVEAALVRAPVLQRAPQQQVVGRGAAEPPAHDSPTQSGLAEIVLRFTDNGEAGAGIDTM